METATRSAELVYPYMRPVPGASKATFCPSKFTCREISWQKRSRPAKHRRTAHEKGTYRAYHAYRALLFGKPAQGLIALIALFAHFYLASHPLGLDLSAGRAAAQAPLAKPVEYDPGHYIAVVVCHQGMAIAVYPTRRQLYPRNIAAGRTKAISPAFHCRP
jgi:hypothetical protein